MSFFPLTVFVPNFVVHEMFLDLMICDKFGLAVSSKATDDGDVCLAAGFALGAALDSFLIADIIVSNSAFVRSSIRFEAVLFAFWVGWPYSAFAFACIE